MLYFFIAFVFLHGEESIAPKAGTSVEIHPVGFTKHDKNPKNNSPFKKVWTLLTWYLHDDGMWYAFLAGKSSRDMNNDPIDPIDICCIVPVPALRYQGHKSKFTNIELALISPVSMKQIWSMDDDTEAIKSESEINVTVENNVKKVRSQSGTQKRQKNKKHGSQGKNRNSSSSSNKDDKDKNGNSKRKSRGKK
ncbi:MAG: hypothetical protein ACPG2Y_00270 [Acholeplasmataceae bacterium]